MFWNTRICKEIFRKFCTLKNFTKDYTRMVDYSILTYLGLQLCTFHTYHKMKLLMLGLSIDYKLLCGPFLIINVNISSTCSLSIYLSTLQLSAFLFQYTYLSIYLPIYLSNIPMALVCSIRHNNKLFILLNLVITLIITSLDSFE